MKIGIDLGGTKTEIVVLNNKGEICYRKRQATPANSYEAILDVILSLIENAETTVGETCTIGIGTPGALSPTTGLLRNSNTVVMNGKPLQRDLEHRIGREIRLANDANCFALSEAVDGAGAGCNLVFGVIVGTGTGAGIVINQQVLKGINAVAGEWGHNPLPWPDEKELKGENCYCGKKGCIETWLAGPSFSRAYQRRIGDLFDAKSIMERYKQGEPAAMQTLDEYVERMAKSLAHVINMLDPDVIVLGGGMGNISELYEKVPLRWGRYVFSDTVSTQLLPPIHGDSSGVRGAAWLWNTF